LFMPTMTAVAGRSYGRCWGAAFLNAGSRIWSGGSQIGHTDDNRADRAGSALMILSGRRRSFRLLSFSCQPPTDHGPQEVVQDPAGGRVILNGSPSSVAISPAAFTVRRGRVGVSRFPLELDLDRQALDGASRSVSRFPPRDLLLSIPAATCRRSRLSSSRIPCWPGVGKATSYGVNADFGHDSVQPIHLLEPCWVGLPHLPLRMTAARASASFGGHVVWLVRVREASAREADEPPLHAVGRRAGRIVGWKGFGGGRLWPGRRLSPFCARLPGLAFRIWNYVGPT